MSKTFSYIGEEAVGKVVIDSLKAEGYEHCEDVKQAQLAFTYCTSQSSLEETYFGEEGLVRLSSKDALFIDLSPSTPGFARELDAIGAMSEFVSVDAPLVVKDVTLSDAFEQKDNLMCFVGGSEDAVEQATEVLSIFIGDVQSIGSSGTAQLTRAGYTLQIVSHIVAAMEANALHQQVNLNSAPLGRTSKRVVAVSPEAEQILQAVEDRKFAGVFSAGMLMAELTAALTTADDVDLILPQAEACLHLLELLALIGGVGKSPVALSLVYGDEKACSEEGLDWSRAEQTYQTEEEIFEDDEDDFKGDDYTSFPDYSEN